MESSYETEENRIVRRVSLFGNGAHVLVPRGWMNNEVVLVNPRKQNLKNKIIKVLMPYLDKIYSVILYGSYARGEEKIDSDIDLLIISNERFKIKYPSFDISVITKDEVDKAIKMNPILVYSAIIEGVSIINNSFLEELKNKKINLKYFKEFIKDSFESLKSDKTIISLDKETENFVSPSVIYSLILRLKGTFIINSLIKKEKYSNERFRQWISEILSEKEANKAYLIYETIKNDEESSIKLNIKTAEELITLLKSELKELKEKI
jgi:predicted nucleotidyltransferase